MPHEDSNGSTFAPRDVSSADDPASEADMADLHGTEEAEADFPFDSAPRERARTVAIPLSLATQRLPDVANPADTADATERLSVAPVAAPETARLEALSLAPVTGPLLPVDDWEDASRLTSGAPQSKWCT